MGTCRHCGKSAGWWRGEHEECAARVKVDELRAQQEATATRQRQQESAAEQARQKANLADALMAVCVMFVQGAPFDVVTAGLTTINEASQLSSAERREMIVHAWEEAATACMEDGDLSKEEDVALGRLMRDLPVSQQEADRNGVLTKAAKLKLMTALRRGLIADVVTIPADFPVVLRKGERALWCFTPTVLLQESGAMIRAPGGPATHLSEPIVLDTGLLLVATHNLYFVGPIKSLQLPLAKITTVKPYERGVSIGRVGVTSKLLHFITPDPAFTAELVSMVARGANA